MFKLIFTIVSLTSTPVTTPTSTSATNSIDFADQAACQRALAAFRDRGDHSMEVQGVTITLHFVGGRCVRDDNPNPDPSRFLEHSKRKVLPSCTGDGIDGSGHVISPSEGCNQIFGR